MKVHIHLLAVDGIHWTPKGHRVITQYLSKTILQIPKPRTINDIHRTPLVENNNANNLLSRSK